MDVGRLAKWIVLVCGCPQARKVDVGRLAKCWYVGVHRPGQSGCGSNVVSMASISDFVMSLPHNLIVDVL